MGMQTSQEIINGLSNYLKTNITDELNLEQVILFGSYAKGTQHEYSDIDVALVSPNYKECNYLEETVKVIRLLRDFDSRIEPHLFSPEEMLEEDNLFVKEILNTGLKVFSQQ